MEKVFQLNDTMKIRTGVVVVGSTGTGKTTVLDIVIGAINNLVESGPEYININLTKINPKAVRTDNLYGYINLLTNEWNDGIIANIIREAVAQQDQQYIG